VATASSMFGTTQHPYLAFDTNSNPDDPYRWVSGDDNYNTSGVYTRSPPQGFTDVDGSTENGEWLKIQLPRKVLVSYFETVAYPTNGSQMLHNYAILGSNDDSSWYQVHKVTGSTTLLNNTSTITPSGTYASTAFKYFAFVWLDCADTVNRHVSMGELRIYGTEPEDVVARIGDGYDGKVRNLRVYSTALSQDRVQEIFDADKDEFGLAKSSVSVYRGHLGIGTTEPKAALTVMDEVGELEEFPPRAMTDYETYMEGHGDFRVSASHDTSDFPAYDAFTNSFGTATQGLWYSGGTYYATTGLYSGTSQLANETKMGEWLQLEFPYSAKIQTIKIYTQYNSLGNHPSDLTIYARNTEFDPWTNIYSYTDLVPTNYGSEPLILNVYSNTKYKYFAFVGTKRNNTTAAGGISFGQIKFLGTREQGASTLHNGELTLTRNLTVPRIGPALDADDTPRRDRLVVEYNTFENPTENGVVKDTSGWGLDGFMYGAYYDATEKALRFDGTDDYIQTGTIHGPSGQWPHSISLWFRTDGETSETWDYLCQFGTNTTGKSTLLGLRNENISFGTYGDSRRSSGVIATNDNWYHVVGVYPGGVLFDTAQIYVNGVLYADDGGADDESSPLSFDSSGNFLMLGNRMSLTDSELGGYISNFKLYDVALTADEVKRLYEMGRHGNVIAKPLYITAPLHAPGSIIQVQYTESNTKQTITASSVQAIPSLTINFTPKFSNSKLLLKAIVCSNTAFVTGFGFIKDGTTVYSGNDSDQNGATGTITTFYDGTGTTEIERMRPVVIQYMIYPGTTNTMTLSPAAAKSWSGNGYALIINDRNSDDMRSLSTFTVYEIAQ